HVTIGAHVVLAHRRAQRSRLVALGEGRVDRLRHRGPVRPLERHVHPGLAHRPPLYPAHHPRPRRTAMPAFFSPARTIALALTPPHPLAGPSPRHLSSSAVRVFVSYRQSDGRAVADIVVDALRAAQYEVFRDSDPDDGARLGDDLVRTLYDEVEKADVVI